MKKKILSIFLITLMLLCTGCERNENIQFGIAREGGVYYLFGNKFSKIMTEGNNISVRTKETAGSAANIRLLSDGYIDVGIAQSDMINDAVNQKGDFENKKYDGFKAVGGIYTEVCQIVVMNDSGINSIDDLQGKKVCIGESESGTEKNARQILSAYGLNDLVVFTFNLNYKDASEELASGKIDALFCTSGTGSEMIKNLSEEHEIRFLSIDDTHMNKIIAANDYLEEEKIPEGTYKGQNKDIKTVGTKAVLLVSDSLDETTVYNITKSLFKDDMKEYINDILGEDITENDAVNGVATEFHNGALKYYKEKGINID